MSLGPICILFGGPIRKITDESGKEWLFEMHPYCGPSVVSKRTHDPLDKQPGPRSLFWKNTQEWIDQGQKVEGDVCVYKPIEHDPLD